MKTIVTGEQNQEQLMTVVAGGPSPPALGPHFPSAVTGVGGPHPRTWPSLALCPQWAGGFSLWKRRWLSLTNQSLCPLFLLESDTSIVPL